MQDEARIALLKQKEEEKKKRKKYDKISIKIKK